MSRASQRNRIKSRILVLFVISLIGFLPATQSVGQQSNDIEVSNISGTQDKPRRHTRIKNIDQLEDTEAEQVYQLITNALLSGYSASGLIALEGYQSLPRFNSTPYLSASHGNYYLNNYANSAAKGYGMFELAEQFAPGSKLYKDSFSVAANGSIILGPLFIMEKMQQGFNPVSGDWKYIQIQPTGDVFGETNGPNNDKVEYCIACHLAQEKSQHLFFVPQGHRASPVVKTIN